MASRRAEVRIESVWMPTYVATERSTLPPLFDPVESMYPYRGYRATSRQPTRKSYQAVVVENDLLRVTVLPELGGRILQIEDVHTGGDYVHVNGAIRPVRIPPRWAYLSVGIELNFPMAHSPTGTEPVGHEIIRNDDGSAGVAVGERELRWGLCWRAEVKLYPGFRGLCVAVRCWNPTETTRNVQWWSNAAQPAGGDTEFVYPDEPLIAHIGGEKAGQWPIVGGRDLRWHRNYDQMCGLFWEPTRQDWFGAYHHERGWGLLHLSDPARLPGKKLWSFGHTGETADWSLSMTRGGARTCEIQAGIPTLQRESVRLEPGQEFSFIEFWIPVDGRDELDLPKRPSFDSIAGKLGGVHRLAASRIELVSPSGAVWKDLMAAHTKGDVDWLNLHAGECRIDWPPTGLDLEPALRWAAERGGDPWRYQLGLWLCATEQWAEARATLERLVSDDAPFPQAHAVFGLLLWKAFGQREQAWEHIRLVLRELSDGQLLTHANALLKEMGLLTERVKLLDIWSEDDFRRRETAADIALDAGDPREAVRILLGRPWEKHHGRRRRFDLWKRAREALGEPVSPVPTSLGEDPEEVVEGMPTYEAPPPAGT